MIAKLAPARQARSFGRLARYICTAPDASRSRRLVSVALHGFGMERTDGLAGGLWRMAADAVEMRHRIRPHSGNLTGHLIVSFEQDESDRLSMEDYSHIERGLLESLDCHQNRRICALHGDTLHLHMHVVYDLLDSSGRLREVYRTFLRLGERRNALCRELGLKAHPLRRGAVSRQEDMQVHKDLESFAAWLRREAVPELKEALSRPGACWEEVQSLLGQRDAAMERSGEGLVFAHRALGIRVRASLVSRALSWRRLRHLLGEFQPATGRAEPRSSYSPRSLVAPRLYQRYRQRCARQRRLNQEERARIRSLHQQQDQEIGKEERQLRRRLGTASDPRDRRTLRQILRESLPRWEKRRRENRRACR